MIKKLLGAIAISLAFTSVCSAEGGYTLDTAPNRINDLPALQHGAKLFVNYCLSCHSANAMRYNRLADLGLTDDEIKKNLLFTGTKVGDLMHVAMTPADGKKWFGTAPPDLSVMARAKSENFGASGVDYIYTYLRTFYRDTSKHTGWDNLVFPNVAMPNVLWQLQGQRTLTRTSIAPKEGKNGEEQWEQTVTTYDPQGYSTVKTEALQNYHGPEVSKDIYTAANPAQTAAFDNDVADLSNFLGWMAEPAQQFRKRLGVWVMLFLALFLLVAWRLNSAYWKNVK
ncbi:cytochrome c1 [Candidimonas nitroreducens]|uniref:Cytochrome c1 n=1 Tax=Candidimonas nitroreducens TaxID=683354 RepID=A0A225LXM8_9BURK|nr:cytochrome c1 [Candidimonas nitroreducens]OWT53908.1 cytochrome c1 [Candidimonas nitroreducens]